MSDTTTPRKPGLARRLYDWMLSWADTPYGTPALFCISFIESSFFPLPPDILQIALSAGKPKRSFFYAFVSLAGSVLGALLGYFIGFYCWEYGAHYFFVTYIPGFTEEGFETVKGWYNANAFLWVWIGAFTIIPYKIFTITAGVCKIPLWTLIVASIIGRGMRFFMVAALLWFYGPQIRTWIEKYFDKLAVLFVIALIGGFLLIKVLM